MSIKAPSALEQNLVTHLMYGFLGPLSGLRLDLYLAKTQEEQLPIVKRFIEKHLPKQGPSRAIDLQDERISELFEEAMQNMVRDTIRSVFEQKKQLQSLIDCLTHLSHLTNNLRPKTWKDYAHKGMEKVGKVVSKTLNRSPLLKGGIDAAHYGLTQIGVLAKKVPVEKEVGIVLIEEEDDWQEVETDDSYEQRVSAILKSWQKNPVLLLEREPVKKDLDYLRNEVLPKASLIIVDAQ